MPYPLPLTRTEAYLAYKAGVIQQSDLKPSLAVPRNGIDAWLAYWTGLVADYPKREDGTPHILQEEEAYIAYLCGVINEYPEKCLRRVGAYLRYLISARWGRPDHPLNREELYLSLIKTQFIPSGDPSSDIEIDGTAKAAFVDVKMYGDTYQKSYAGKNLCDYTDATYPYSGYGITAVLNGDDSITVDGLPTKPYIIIVQKDITDTLEDGATYTISCDNYGADFYLDIVGQRSGGGTAYPANTRSGAASFTVDKTNITSYEFRIETYTMASWGESSKTITRKFQLEKGATASAFEPYVGGVPSPNPDYPQPIQTVTGRQVVNVKGKNLFVPPNSATSRGVTFTKNEDGSFNISGKAVGGEALCSIFTDINLKDGESLTLSSNVGLSTGIVYRVEAYNGNTWIVSLISQVSIMPTTITIPQNATRLRYSIGLLEGREVNLTNVTFQLEKGTATAYEPYTSTSYPLDLGSIELCKLGTYQDYIYKDGNDWKVHKATSKTTITNLSTITGVNSTSENTTRVNFSGVLDPIPNGLTASDRLYSKSDHFSAISNYKGDSVGIYFSNTSSGDTWFRANKTEIGTTEDSVKAWLVNNPVKLYYPIPTATDTVITDQTLIAQLKALKNGGAENGTTYIKVNAVDPNLPGLLYVEAPKYE